MMLACKGRIDSEPIMLAFLEQHSISYSYIRHPAVFTCEEAHQYRPAIPGLETKNLFLRDDDRRCYLVMTDCALRMDLKALGSVLSARKLQFGSAPLLMDVLGLTPGSVTVLGLVNDLNRRVQLVVDSRCWPAPTYLCHPLVNTATLVIEHAALLRFFSITGHIPLVV